VQLDAHYEQPALVGGALPQSKVVTSRAFCRSIGAVQKPGKVESDRQRQTFYRDAGYSRYFSEKPRIS
jgi:hypothetical protein